MMKKLSETFPNNLLTPPINLILENRAFLDWSRQEESCEIDSINLYLAILDYEAKLESNKVAELTLVKLARHIHRKYVSLNTGSCGFLDTPLRTQQSTRIHELLDGKLPYKSLFDPLKPPVIRMINSKFSEFSNLKDRTKEVSKTESFQSASSSSNHSAAGAYIWFNEDACDPISRHDVQLATVTHESEDARFAFFNEVCSRLNDLQGTHSPQISSQNSPSSKMSPYGVDGFAPPPIIAQPPPPPNNLPKRFESLYRKKRQQQAVVSSETSSGFGSAATDSYPEKFRSLDRSNRNHPMITNGFLTLQPRRNRITREIPVLQLELRYENDVPMVARIQNQAVTFRYFRHLFGVDYNDNCRFFFKSICEDGSASYQWTLILNDDDILPLFQDRITAICRLCPSSDLI